MTGPRVEKPPPHPDSPEAFFAAQPTGLRRGLSPDEFIQAQGMTPTQLKAWKLPPLNDYGDTFAIAPRDVTRTPNDKNVRGKTSGQWARELTGGQAVVEHLTGPLIDHPWMSAGAIGASMIPVVGPFVVGAMAGDLASNIALYGYQKHLETQATPEARKIMEADPERISGEAAIAQGIMLGLIAGHAAVGKVKAARAEAAANAPMEIRANVPKVEPQVPTQTVEPRVTPAPTDVADMEIPISTQKYGAERKAYEAQRVIEEENLSAARRKAADQVVQAEALRPRRRAADLVHSDQGAEALGTAAAQHGLPADASPYPPNTSQDVAWKAGHDAVTTGGPPEAIVPEPTPPSGTPATTEPLPSYPEGFAMGGPESRIPAKSELPKVARGTEPTEGGPPVTGRPITVEVYRGARPGRGLADNPATGGATFASTDPSTGTTYATKSPEHVLHRITGTFDNPLVVKSLSEYRKALGLPEGSSQEQGIAAARAAGYDAIIHNNGKLVVILDNSKAIAEQIDHTTTQSEGSVRAAAVPVTEPVAAGEGSALSPVEGTGETKTRGLAAGVAEKAVANKLDAAIGDLPEYSTVKMADQAARATDILTHDPAFARQIALGKRPAPDGVLPEAVFTAVENKAIADGDAQTLYDLAHGDLTTQATTMGQRIRALGERDPDSPVGIIKDINRVKSGGQNVQKQTLSTVKDIEEHFSGLQVAEKAWKDFLESLKC